MASTIAAHRKALAALVGCVVTWGAAAQANGYTATDWWALAVAVATALGVYAVPNDATSPG